MVSGNREGSPPAVGETMEAYEARAYECMGWWTVTVIRVSAPDTGGVTREMVYQGTHDPIDEEDPLIRAHLLFDQVARDLSWSMSDLAVARPPGRHTR